MCNRCLALTSTLLASAIAATATIPSPSSPHGDGKLVDDQIRADMAELLHIFIPAMETSEQPDAVKLAEFTQRLGPLRCHLVYSVAYYFKTASDAMQGYMNAAVQTFAETGSQVAKDILSGAPPSIAVIVMQQKKAGDPPPGFHASARRIAA